MCLISSIIDKFRKTFTISVLLSIIAGVGHIGLIILITRGHTNLFAFGFKPVYAFVLLLVSVFLTSLVSDVLLAKVSQKSVCELQIMLGEKILHMPFRKIEKIGKSNLYANLTQDIMILSTFITMIPTIFINIIIVLTALIYLGFVSLKIFSITLIMLILMVSLFVILDSKFIKVRFSKAREYVDQLFDSIQTLLDGAKELRLNKKRRQYFIEHELIRSARLTYKNNFKAMNMFLCGQEFWKLLFFVLLGLLAFSPKYWLSINTFSIMQSIMLLMFIMSPLSLLVNTIPIARRFLISLKKIEQLQSAVSMDIIKENSNLYDNDPQLFDGLTLQEVSYSYFDNNKETFKLGPLNLALKPAEIVFIVGKMGAVNPLLLN